MPVRRQRWWLLRLKMKKSEVVQSGVERLGRNALLYAWPSSVRVKFSHYPANSNDEGDTHDELE